MKESNRITKAELKKRRDNLPEMEVNTKTYGFKRLIEGFCEKFWFLEDENEWVNYNPLPTETK